MSRLDDAIRKELPDIIPKEPTTTAARLFRNFNLATYNEHIKILNNSRVLSDIKEMSIAMERYKNMSNEDFEDTASIEIYLTTTFHFAVKLLIRVKETMPPLLFDAVFVSYAQADIDFGKFDDKLKNLLNNTNINYNKEKNDES